jgi:glycosyltransferase involved in cell wall biosynthesis
MESWDFGRQSANWMITNRVRNYDVVYANTWPLFGQHHVARAARFLQIRLVMHVQDVYPESLATKLAPWLYRLCAPPLRIWDHAIAHRCAALVLPSCRLAAAYRHSRHLNGRVHVVRNWIDSRPFEAQQDRADVCSEYDVPADRFTYMYLGNLSALSALDTAIRGFAQLKDEQARFVVVGEGAMKAKCQALVRDLHLDRSVLFRSEPDSAKVARVQSMADVFVLTARRGGALASTPSKCISYMLSGKPIVAAVDAESDTADDLRSADCAWVCAPDDVPALAAALRAASVADAGRRRSMGASARSYAREHFAMSSCLPKLTAAMGVPSNGRGPA